MPGIVDARNDRGRGTLTLVAALVLALLVVPIATAGDSDVPDPQARASVQTQIQKLKKQVRKLKRQVKGPAGGDLTGNYPNPAITNGAVNSAKVADGSLTGDDLAGGSITGGHVANGSLSGEDIADGGITGADISNQSITGADIDLAQLGTVPFADRATFLDSGESLVGAEILSYTSGIDATETPLFSAGGIAMSASCDAGNLVVEVTSTSDNASITSVATTADVAPALVNSVYDGDFDATEDENLVAADQTRLVGHTEFVGPGGAVAVTINWTADEGTLDFCVFSGTVVYGSG